MSRCQKTWLWVGAIAVVALVGWHWTTLPSPRAERRFAEETAVLALGALGLAVIAAGGAILAARYAKPAFDEYLEQLKKHRTSASALSHSGETQATRLSVSSATATDVFATSPRDPRTRDGELPQAGAEEAHRNA